VARSIVTTAHKCKMAPPLPQPSSGQGRRKRVSLGPLGDLSVGSALSGDVYHSNTDELFL
jgi:hypothetical protein